MVVEIRGMMKRGCLQMDQLRLWGLLETRLKKFIKKEGSPFGKDFSTSSREAKKFQEAHSILQIAADIKIRDCGRASYKARDGWMKPSHKAFLSKMSTVGYKVKDLSWDVAHLSTQPKNDKNIAEIKQSIKKIDLELERARKNVEIGDRLEKLATKELKSGRGDGPNPGISGMIEASAAAHAYAGALNTLKYIASSLIEK